ncbi:hypothetical protein SprV_0200539100 [Sparganum proliferum]
MEMNLEYIRRKALPRILENLEDYPEDTATDMYERLRYRFDAGMKEVVETVSDLRSEVMQRFNRLEDLPKTATPELRQS